MKMKKLLALGLAAIMTVSAVACGDSGAKETKAAEGGAANSDYKVAMITDSGDITDQSFNQTTYEACKAFCEANNVEFTYKKPDGDTDDARIAMVDAAVGEGYNVIVMPGYLFAASVVDCSAKYEDVKFVALDVSAGDLLGAALGDQYDYNPANWKVEEYYNTANTYCTTYAEELPGYMAGVAAVKLGYKKLGFVGGMAVPAVIRFGYGFVQGANDAAKDLGITNEVEVEYAYGGVFYGTPEITAVMDTWCQNGTEAIFACGGGVYASAAEAAAKTGAKLIGVDSDQSSAINKYGDGMCITSAMKGLAATVNSVLDAIILSNTWESNFAGKIENLGLASGDDLALNYVQLPDTTQWADGFTQDDYKSLVKDMFDKKVEVSNATDVAPTVDIKVNYREGSIM